ncbi:hypothetical protein [Nocardiopsis lambiniae]|uniref:Uncharacterized protein n=1 Tax=Nocardiopsis lambiniae TaxID=3075539 RepID=A0ABU2M8R9_9ACTN|nr:hypothetical protein [Nocardiopsis sp. DSM 44743]MDT0329005.1 hypothetical protein [Nocardiopsis sp. DSM 44743]
MIHSVGAEQSGVLGFVLVDIGFSGTGQVDPRPGTPSAARALSFSDRR